LRPPRQLFRNGIGDFPEVAPITVRGWADVPAQAQPSARGVTEFSRTAGESNAYGEIDDGAETDIFFGLPKSVAGTLYKADEALA
jgi:hypothetical protein